MANPHVYRTRLFPTARRSQPPEPPIQSDSVGVALSGGGSRSLVASMGQLRGLRHLGVMDRVWGISSASGGSWASVPYTYLPEKILEGSFLGMVVPNPSDLTWFRHSGEPNGAALNYLAPNNLGAVTQKLGMVAVLDEATRLIGLGLQPSESWPMAIGSLILRPFGLYEGNAQGQALRSFTWHEASYREDVEKLNPGVAALSRDQFCVVERDDRPFLMVSSSVVPRRGHAPLLPYEITPLSAGLPGFHAEMGPGERDLGGGSISPFAVGSNRAMEDTDDTARVTQPIRPFSLADMAGLSSVAPAEEMQVHAPQSDAMIPSKMLWPVRGFDEPRNSAWPYLFADGGSLENSAVVALLRRPLRRILSFMNSETPLAEDRTTGQIVVDAMFPPLFGYQPHVAGQPYQRYPEDENAPVSESAEVYRHNQVFEADEFFPAINGLWNATQAGGAAMLRQNDLRVVPNPWFGVKGGHEVDVLWIYNFRARAFVSQLSWQLRLAMALGLDGLRDFPYYNTETQMRLNARQINLLAHLATWTVMGESEAGHPGQRNADVVSAMFSGRTD